MPDTNLPNDGTGSEPEPTRRLPSISNCRARRSGIGDFVDCLVNRPYDCEHALSFANGFFCLHPQRAEIVARTEAGYGEGSR
jgi:hypothetical protein